jgi:hypothetical protein
MVIVPCSYSFRKSSCDENKPKTIAKRDQKRRRLRQELCSGSQRIRRIEDLCHFAAPLVRTKEIIIPQESAPDLLDRILGLQQPAKTDRIREEMRNPEGLTVIPKQNFHAQIISLAA